MPERRLEQRFALLRQSGRRALVPYITAGFPQPTATLPLLHSLAAAGADVIELGIPFSDPLADGPTIQRASQRALESGATPARALADLAAFRTRDEDTAVVVFSYINPVLAYGAERFVAQALEAGADGLLLTDLPLDSDPELESMLERSELALVRLIAPTTTPGRAAAIAARSQGFVYYISRTGVTGARREVRAELAGEIDSLRRATAVPIAVGFGISSPEQAAAVARVADGIVIGSALIERLDRDGIDGAASFVAEMRAALDSETLVARR